MAFAHATLRRVSQDRADETVRIYRPTSPVVAFGRRDERLPGFKRAVGSALERGFTPVLRPTGGRAVAYTEAALVVDHTRHEINAVAGQEQRFISFGTMFADMFREWGIDARVGAVPGEYCAGAQSVNARGVVKLVGTAQRVVRDGWLFSSLIVVGDDEPIKEVLSEVYRHLDQDFDEGSVGSLTTEAPGLGIDLVESMVARAIVGDTMATPAARDGATIDLALQLFADHATE
nr:lipoate--protein ligase family protein [Nocardioides ginsengisegetis]